MTPSLGRRKRGFIARKRPKTRLGAKKRKKTKLPSITKLIKQADAILSIQVRGLDKDPEGFANCYTCPAYQPRKMLQCGHWISRRHKAVRWHRDNVRIQCGGCNKFRNGEPIKFRKNLVAEIGAQRVSVLEDIYDQKILLTREFLLSKIEELKKT